MGSKPPNVMKYFSLIVVTINSALLGLSMRYARIKTGDMFLPSTAILMSEVVKFILCLILVYFEEGKSLRNMQSSLYLQVFRQPWDTLKVGVPSFLYIIQNNLLYAAASNLDAATYQVTYQLRILTTALFSVLILKKKLILTQWLALVMLLIGVISVQLADTQSASAPKLKQNRLLGVLAALCACPLTGYAGIYLEQIYKGSDISLWVRNIQLSFLSLTLGLFTTLAYDYSAIREKGFFFGYDGFVIYLIILQAVGGLISAMVTKYADNILKAFATALGIIIICIVSVYLFNFVLSFQFAFGIILVISSIYAYNYKPRNRPKIHV